MKVRHIVPKFVSSFPTDLTPGTLYVSTQFSSAVHLCACGCGRQVVTPLSPAHWVLTFDGAVSMEPSIGNWALPCQSHYVIDRGMVRWARGFSKDEIRRNREKDFRALDEVRNPTTRSWRYRLGSWLRQK